MCGGHPFVTLFAMTDVAERLAAVLRERPEDLVAAWLFGSRARGEAHAASDVDVAVLFRTAPPPTLDGLPVELQAALEGAVRAPVDVVVLNDASADLVHRVLREGVLLVERDRSARIAFEVDRRRRYLDMLPVWRAYRSARTRAT